MCHSLFGQVFVPTAQPHKRMHACTIPHLEVLVARGVLVCRHASVACARVAFVYMDNM